MECSIAWSTHCGAYELQWWTAMKYMWNKICHGCVRLLTDVISGMGLLFFDFCVLQ